MTFKQRLRRLFILFTAGFVLLFAGRLIWGHYAYPDGEVYQEEAGYYTQSLMQDQGIQKNYATSEYKYRADGGGASFEINQKYEKSPIFSAPAVNFPMMKRKCAPQWKDTM